MSKPTQEDFRWAIKEALADEMFFLEYPTLGELTMGSWQNTGNKGIDKALDEAYNSLELTLRKFSRLAVRLGYINSNKEDSDESI